MGRVSARQCRERPWSVVSLCAPDPWTVRGCGVTLCFDAEELAALFPQAPGPDAGPMPNPALTLDPDLPRKLGRGVTLRPTLDAASVECLAWQVALARERGLLERLQTDAQERHLLVDVVLPFLAAWLLQGNRMVGLVVNLYREWTPAFLQRALRRAGTALLFLLRSPILSTLAILTAKVLRIYLCYMAFGLNPRQWDVVHDRLREYAGLKTHFPFVMGLLEILTAVFGCITGFVTGLGPGLWACVQQVGQSLVGTLRMCWGFVHGGVGGPSPFPPFRLCRVRGGGLKRMKDSGVLLKGRLHEHFAEGWTAGMRSLLGTTTLDWSFGQFRMFRKEVGATLDRVNAVEGTREMLEAFESFYNRSSFGGARAAGPAPDPSLSLTLLLWWFRYVPARSLLDGLSWLLGKLALVSALAIPMIGGPLAGLLRGAVGRRPAAPDARFSFGRPSMP